MQLYSIIDRIRGTSVVKEFDTLKQELLLGYDYLEVQRTNKLIKLLEQMRSHPFYAPCLSGFEQQTLSTEPYRVLSTLPVVNKDIIGNYPNWFTRPANATAYEERFSSGSTGSPFRYHLSKYSISRIVAFNFYLWHHFLSFNIGDKILGFGGNTIGERIPFKSRVYDFLQNKKSVPGGVMNEQALHYGFRLLNESDYSIIYSYVTSLDYFVSEALKRNIKFKKKIKGVVTNAEMLPDATRNMFREFFGCEVLNCYGARDGGVMAGEVKSILPGFYFNSFDCVAEDIELDQEFGKKELLLTNLNNPHFPFIRYRVGDIGCVEPHASTDLLPVHKINHIEGRVCDLVYSAGYGAIHGAALNIILKASGGIDSYQIVQQADYSIDVRIKSSTGSINADAVIAALRNLMKDDKAVINVLINHDFIIGSGKKTKLIVSYINPSES